MPDAYNNGNGEPLPLSAGYGLLAACPRCTVARGFLLAFRRDEAGRVRRALLCANGCGAYYSWPAGVALDGREPTAEEPHELARGEPSE